MSAGAETRTLIISQNDLEAATLCDLATSVGFLPIDLKLPWGGMIDPADARLSPDRLGRHVVIVEHPAPQFERALEASGRIVRIIDHHLYIDAQGELLDRQRRKSSLEQFAGLYLGQSLNFRQQLIAANDAGFWPAIFEAGGDAADSRYQDDEDAKAYRQDPTGYVAELRLDDLKYRFDSNREAAKQRLGEACAWLADGAEASGALRVFGCGGGVRKADQPELILIRAPSRFQTVLADAVYGVHLTRPHNPPRANQIWRHHEARKDRALEMLIVYVDEGQQLDDSKAVSTPRITQVEYSGPGERKDLLRSLVEELRKTSGLRVWVGGGRSCCYLGADQGEGRSFELQGLADRLVNNLLIGNRPLHRWRSQFFQVLRYDRKDKDEKPKFKQDARTFVTEDPVGEQERNYLLSYMRPFLAARKQGEKGAVDERDACLLGVDPGAEIDPHSLTIHSYRYDGQGLRLRIEWRPWENIVRADEREFAHVKIHFMFHHLVVIEWCFQDGWPEAEAAEKETHSLVEQLLHFPALVRDERHTKRTLHPGTDENAQSTAFPPDPIWDDEFPTLKVATAHEPGVDAIAELLDFNEAARMCFSSFLNPGERKDIILLVKGAASSETLRYAAETSSGSDRLAGWFKRLAEIVLEPFGIEHDDVALVLDERARVVSAAAVVGAHADLPAACEAEDVLLARLTTVESYGPTYFYHPPFARRELGEARFSRFDTTPPYPGTGTRYAATDHSLVMLGFGWFAANVAIKHVACQYQRLFLTGLLYASVFHRFSHELGDISRRRLDQDAEHAVAEQDLRNAKDKCERRAARERRSLVERCLDELASDAGRVKALFVGFANGLWFDDVSTQIQGKEMFDLIVGRLRLAQAYREITEEIERTDQLERADAEQRAQRRARQLTVLGSAVAGLLLLGTVIGPLVDVINLGTWSGWAWTSAFAICLLGVAAVPVVVLSVTRNVPVKDARDEIRGFLENIGGRIKELFKWREHQRDRQASSSPKVLEQPLDRQNKIEEK